MTSKPTDSLTIEDLVQSYFSAVVRLAVSILDDGHPGNIVDEAEDAAQEVFIAAARGLDHFRGDASPKTWLFAITINTCRSKLRRKKAKRLIFQAFELFEQQTGDESPAGRYEVSERDARLWKEIDHLDEKHRMVVVLHYLHGLPTRETADVLGISEGTVYSRLYHARQILASRLRQSLGWEEAAAR
jgi:RNA polymerase sigma-70 factor, ECF subfamily